ncbi:MAG: hypothetical protein AB8G95_24415 [Anaerolineae bacterium]
MAFKGAFQEDSKNSYRLPEPVLQQGLIADPETKLMYVPPRTYPGRSPQLSTIHVNWNPASCTGEVTPWPEDAKVAFAFGAAVWEGIIASSVPIAIDACWRPLGSNVLGAAGATGLQRNFANAPESNTWYPVALANALSEMDLNGNTAEIGATFSSQFSNWYFGTDGNPGPSQYDFVTVVIHEIGHGLGFAGSMFVSSGNGQYGYSGVPTIYDRNAENGSGVPLVGGFANGSVALGNQLTGGNVFIDGDEVRKANGGNPVELYAPSSWSQGSSFSHLDDVFDGSNNALMTHSIANGEAIHDPGEVTLGLFSDMAWQVAAPGSPPPTVTPTPNPTVPAIDDEAPKAIYLPAIMAASD